MYMDMDMYVHVHVHGRWVCMVEAEQAAVCHTPLIALPSRVAVAPVQTAPAEGSGEADI